MLNMKRLQKYKKVNRRNNVITHLNRNVVCPSLFLSSEEINQQGFVEMIELKSDEEPEKEHIEKNNYSHIWCYESDDQEHSCRINKETKERRRCRVGDDNDDIYNELFDQICTNFYGIDCHNSHDETSENRDVKCFTIINNQLPYSTSSDDEEAEYCDILNGNRSKEFDDNVNYNNGYAGKRTGWIYSEKNKKELSDYDFKNISNKNSTSSSTDHEDQIRDINLGSILRLATPIPTCIPKLFLPSSPKLPTVTEVMESYNRSSSNTEVNQSNSMTPQMPINNWVQEQPVENESDSYHKANNKTFTWDALSLREKRRLRNSMNEEKRNIDNSQKPTAIVNQSALANEDIIETGRELQINECISSAKELHLKHSFLHKMNHLRKPQIKLNHKIQQTSEIITEPLEKKGKWTGEETDETLDVYDYDLEQNDAKDTSDVEIKNYNNRGNQFFESNMSFLKSITDSLPSLHLSFQTEYENESWLLRLFDCFKCCKRYK